MSSAETQQSAQDGRVNAETAVRAQAEWRRADWAKKHEAKSKSEETES